MKVGWISLLRWWVEGKFQFISTIQLHCYYKHQQVKKHERFDDQGCKQANSLARLNHGFPKGYIFIHIFRNISHFWYGAFILKYCVLLQTTGGSMMWDIVVYTDLPMPAGSISQVVFTLHIVTVPLLVAETQKKLQWIILQHILTQVWHSLFWT